ncbi:MAG: HAMP domain-containing histidine kinase [Bacteroidia bacterium]|nr:HAMP domain-containing histidine kinase [Bacteroidia bacterium]
MMHKALKPLFLAVTGLLLVLLSHWLYRVYEQTPEQLAERCGKAMEKKFMHMEQALSGMDTVLFRGDLGVLIAYYEKDQVALYRFSSDSLVFWNTSRLQPDRRLAQMKPGIGMMKLPQGYCLYSTRSKARTTDVALCLVKPDYIIQNNYLKNDFLPWTGLNEQHVFTHDSLGAFHVKAGKAVLFSFKTQEVGFIDPLVIEWCSLLFFLGLVLFVLSVLQWNAKRTRAVDLVWLLPALFLLRVSISAFKWPEFLYQSSLYDVREFGDASGFLSNYFGDLLLNVLFLLFAVTLVYRQVSRLITGKFKLLYGLLYLVLIFIAYGQFNQGIASMVQNSTLSFDFLSVFNMKPLAIFGVAIIGLCSLVILVGLRGLYALVVKEGNKGHWLFLLLVVAVCMLYYFSFTHKSVTESFWMLAPAFAFFLLKPLRAQNFTYTLIVFVLLCSVFASYFFSVYLEKNQHAEMKLISFRLSERQDPALENEYKGLPEKIKNDQRLKNLIVLLPNTRLEIAQLLKQNYFNAYFDRYTTDFLLFDKKCQPLLEHSNPVYWNQGYFDDQLNYHSDSTFSEGLYFIKDYRLSTRYVSKLALGENTLFVVMEAKELGEQGSFPDLLLDESQQKQDKLGHLSYAVYRSDRLVNHYGEFNYPHFTPEPEKLESDKSTYTHYVFEPESGTKVVLSEKVKSLTEKLTYNSYFFLLFSLLSFLLLTVYRFLFSNRLAPATLTQRIQGSIIVLLLLAMTAVGITSSRLVTRQFDNENKKELSIKSSIILNELLNQFSSENLFDGSQRELINQRIKEYARVFNSDVSLFNAQGQLVNTSQPKLYDLGLSAGLVNPKAYYGIKQNTVYSGKVTESAGNLVYSSHYEPVYNAAKQLQGFINLPYFAKQSGLLVELSGIISGLINVYMVLFMLSLASGLVLSRYITQPLRLIKQQIARISLGKRNEHIQWQSRDEIGKLVYEYNLMLSKLEESANLLAQSERESAWREMAKQVAHEIKNPLTPMKLNLQYLQHLNKTRPEDFKLKFEQASAGIIEQIDALANIATEFSNFAKLPGAQLEDIAPLDILQSAVHLFNKQPLLRIVFDVTERQRLCKGDKEQCMRVFNNILSNAVEALEGVAEPKITIGSTWKEDTLVVSITDNGCGIPEDMKPVLFTPSFTTKTTGSGLGLAMVKNIMQGFGGRVWFESQASEGSTFYLEFVRSGEAEVVKELG